MQEDYPTSVAYAVNTMNRIMQKMQGSHFVFFIPALLPTLPLGSSLHLKYFLYKLVIPNNDNNNK